MLLDLFDAPHLGAFLIIFTKIWFDQMSVASFAFRCTSALKQSAPHSARLFSPSLAVTEALKFCVVGSGPAGFYTVDKVTDEMILPPPLSLIRFVSYLSAFIEMWLSDLLQILKRFEGAEVDIVVSHIQLKQASSSYSPLLL